MVDLMVDFVVENQAREILSEIIHHREQLTVLARLVVDSTWTDSFIIAFA